MTGDYTILTSCLRSPSTWTQHGDRKSRRTCSSNTQGNIKLSYTFCSTHYGYVQHNVMIYVLCACIFCLRAFPGLCFFFLCPVLLFFLLWGAVDLLCRAELKSLISALDRAELLFRPRFLPPKPNFLSCDNKQGIKVDGDLTIFPP